jgi:NADH-quinone oxidoreductase subunit L
METRMLPTEPAALPMILYPALAVVFLPLLGLLVNLLLGRRLSEQFGEKGVAMAACLACGVSFAAAVTLAFMRVSSPQAGIFHLMNWISVGDFQAGWTLRVDALSVTMMLVVTGVGTLIHIYAAGYMHDDVRLNEDPSRYRRFFIFFNLFIFAMLLLVTADNFLMMFVGWEGVGLCSYLLIGFWFEKGEDGLGNARAGKKAFIVNRIGDFGLLMAIFLIFSHFGSLQFDEVFNQVSVMGAEKPGVLLAITLFMLLGVTGKSAQLPLFVWLPDAMAGPTPVSALIHAATMVTAGVYLMARSSVLFVAVPVAGSVATWVGTLTAFIAASIAIGQFDIKKVLAYSTISQLGFMVAAAGMAAYSAALFHLVTHAFFKALLFLAAGSVIQGMERGHHHDASEGQILDPQDMRTMGGLQGRMRTTFAVYLAGALALAGVAPLAGFFSKDEILAAASQTSPAVFILLALSALMTAFYMGRQVMLVFQGKPRSAAAAHASESPAVMTTPLIVLAILSVVGGLLNFPGLHWLETWLEHSLAPVPAAGFVPWVAALSLAAALLGLFMAWLVYGARSLGSPEKCDPLVRMLGPVLIPLQRKWYLDEIYHLLVVRPFQYVSSEILGAWLDQEVIDGAVNDLGGVTQWLARAGRKLQNGQVRTYALTILLGVILMLGYVILK